MRNALDFWRPISSVSPAKEVSLLHQGIDRLFDDLWGSFQTGTNEMTRFSPSCDIEEFANEYKLLFDLPGVQKEDVKIEVIDNQLTVTGERKQEKKEDGKTRHMVERYYGAFQRTFTLPTSVDADRVQATYKDGVLTVQVPKSEASKPKQIRVH